MARTVQEKAIDRLLDLYVIDRCSRIHGIKDISEIKMHKLMFYSERRLNKFGCKTLNYKFVKLLYPTYSEELRTDLNELASLGFLGGPFFQESEKTKTILEDFSHIFRDNQEILRLLDSEVDKHAPIPTDILVTRTRHLRWRRNKTIGGLENGTPLVYPLSTARVRSSLKISEEDLEDLAICLSPKISSDMEQAFDEMRRGKLLTHAEVFGEL